MPELQIFAVTSYGPHTALTGGRLRRDNIVAALTRRGHAVDRLDLPAPPGTRSGLAAGRLALLGGIRERARRAEVVLLGDVFCLPMMPVLARVGTPVVVDLVDSPYRLVQAAPRHTVHERATAAGQSAQLLLVMQALLPMADGVTYISAEDAEVDKARVCRLPPASIVPNGVDPALFDMPLTLPPPAHGYLAWLADWTYAPNRESFTWFAREVAPRLPDAVLARLRLFGAGDPRPTRPCDSRWVRLDLIEHAGFVDPLTAVYQGARAVVAPVVRGAGLNNKVLEPLAAGRPVLTTSVGSRGLPSDVARHVVVAATPEALAHEVLDLLHAQRTLDCAEAARAAVRSFSWDTAGAAMEAALLAAVRSGTNRTPAGR